MRTPLLMLASLALLGASSLAGAQSTGALVDKYATLAGSKDNATVLVNGLRTSTDFKLGGTSFATPTKKLGNGGVNIALSLTEASLAKQNISSPSAEQLKLALEPILAQRADGKGWGEIANAMGMRLGDVMRSDKARGQDRVARVEPHSAHVERPDRLERPDKPERPERPEKPERAAR